MPPSENKNPLQVNPVNPPRPSAPPADSINPSPATPSPAPAPKPTPSPISTMDIPTGDDLPKDMTFRAEPPDFPDKETAPQESPETQPSPKAEIYSEPNTPVPPKPATPAPKAPETTFLKSLRTYQGDVAESVKKQKTSLVGMVMAEEKKRQAIEEVRSPLAVKNIIFIISGLIFLSLGGAGIYYFLTKPDLTATPETKVSSLLFAEKTKNISVTGLSSENLAKTISQEVLTGNTRLDSVENITFSEKINGEDVPLFSQRLFFFLDHRMPPSLFRSIGKNFMLGVHTFNGNNPFLVFGTDSYENAFAGMLSWEKFMARDLFPIFAIKKDSGDKIFERAFEDRTIKNWDARVLLDDDGKPILFYVFRGRQTIIITTKEDTLEEVVRRLNSAGPIYR